jgi:DNA ligase (NAD+)
LYALKDRVDELAEIERMGQKSSQNLIQAIENSKSRGLAAFFYALGIRHIGEKTSALISQKYKDIVKLYDITAEELTQIKDIGEESAKMVVNYFSNPQNIEYIKKFISCGVKTYIDETDEDNINVSEKLNGLKFVVTGTLVKYKRDEIEKLIVKNGGEVSSSVSKKTDYVLAGENAGSKLEKAAALGVKVISEDEFGEMLE